MAIHHLLKINIATGRYNFLITIHYSLKTEVFSPFTFTLPEKSL